MQLIKSLDTTQSCPKNPDIDTVLAEDSELSRLVNLNLYDNLYYIDGKITEKPNQMLIISN